MTSTAELVDVGTSNDMVWRDGQVGRVWRSCGLIVLSCAAIGLAACTPDTSATASPGATAGTTAAPGTIPRSTICEIAADLTAARLADAALAAYALADPPCDDAGTAVPLLGSNRAAAQQAVSQAERAVADGDLATARLRFNEAIALDAGNTAAGSGLSSLLTPPGSSTTTSTTARPSDVERILREGGLDAEAQDYLVKAIEAGEITTISEEQDSTPSLWQRIITVLRLPATWVLVFIAAAGALYALAARSTRNGRRPFGQWSFCRNRFAPQVQFQSGDGDGVEYVGAEVRHIIQSLASRGAQPNHRIVTSSESSLESLPDLSDLDSRLRAFQWLAKFVGRQDVIRVTPTLSKRPDNSHELIVEISANLTVRTTGSSRSPARCSARFDGDASPSVLSARAAGWLVHQLHEMRPHTVAEPDTDDIGITSPTCYSAWLGGNEALRLGLPDEARQLYTKACTADPDAVAPQLNLAYVEISSPSPFVIAGGIARLERLAAAEPADSADAADTLRKLFNLAIAYTNLGYYSARPPLPEPQVDVPASSEPLDVAAAYCDQVIDAAMAQGDRNMWLAPAVLLRAGIGAMQGAALPAPPEVADAAYTRDPHQLELLRAEGSEATHLELATWALTYAPATTTESAYNAACYWSKVEAADEALSALGSAAASAALRLHAHTDPALDWLRTNHGAAMAELVGPLDKPDGDTPPQPALTPLPKAFRVGTLLVDTEASSVRARGWSARPNTTPTRVDLLAVDDGAGITSASVRLWSRVPLPGAPTVTVSLGSGQAQFKSLPAEPGECEARAIPGSEHCYEATFDPAVPLATLNAITIELAASRKTKRLKWKAD